MQLALYIMFRKLLMLLRLIGWLRRLWTRGLVYPDTQDTKSISSYWHKSVLPDEGLGGKSHIDSSLVEEVPLTAKLISIDPLWECSVQPLCLCLHIKLTKFGYKSEEGHDLQHRIFVRLMYDYLYFLVLIYHCHWKPRHVGADIKYKLVFMSASLKLHILPK